MKILLVSGAKESKSNILASDLIQECAKKNMTVQVLKANLYSDNLQAMEDEEKPDIILLVGTNKLLSQTPIINGLALMYPWMGLEKLINEIAVYYESSRRTQET